ncbi:MAG TPA: hypothetical protein VJ437_10415 [Acidiferrobacterales bacterium]|nr:hypothetical protein [Acidiferrobacterales bacterium]
MHNPMRFFSCIALILGSGVLLAPPAAWASCANPPSQWLLCEDWENGGPVRDVLDDLYWTDEANWRPAEHGWDFTWSSYYCGAGPNATPAPGSPSGGHALDLHLHPEDGTVCRSHRPGGDVLANGWDTAFPAKMFSPRREVYVRIYHLAALDFAWNININKLLYVNSSGPGSLPNVKITGARNSDYYNDYGVWPQEGEFLLAGQLPTYLGQNTGPAEAAIAKKGTWQCIEYRMVLGTPGTSDGHLQLWVDDVLVMDYPNVANSSWVGDIREVQLSGYYGGGGNILSQAQSRWVDDIVVSTSRIGCAGADTLAPAAPTNLSVQ